MKKKILFYLKDNSEVNMKEFEKYFSDIFTAEFYDALEQLEKDEIITYNANNKVYSLASSNFFITTIMDTKKGKPYILVDGQKHYLRSENLYGALPGCEVEMCKIDKEYYVTEILNRENSITIVEVCRVNGKNTYIPYNFETPYKINILEKDQSKFIDGDRIIVNFKNDVTNGNLTGIVKKVICNKKDANSDINTLCSEFDFRFNFSEETKEEVSKIDTELINENFVGRADLRDETVVTIDPINSMDLDDAFSLIKTDNGYILKTHIADVAHYVKPHSATFIDALKNTTSIYLGAYVVPMLPHQISSGICSLHQNVDRLVRTVEIHFDLDGKPIDYKKYKSVIKSKKQMNYNDVQKVFDGETVKGYEDFEEILKLTKELALKLNIEREKRGYLKFMSNEIKFDYDKNDKITNAYLDNDGLAHDFIENIMVYSNHFKVESFGTLPIIYRNHAIPSQKKIESAINKIKEFDINLTLNKDKSSKIYLQSILKDLSKEEASLVLSKYILTTFERAYYGTENQEHFGLGLDIYGHTTSPIRRIADYMVQVAEDFYNNPDITAEDILEFEKKLDEISLVASERERDAAKVESKFEQIEMAKFMESKIGETFILLISGIYPKYITVIARGMTEGKIMLNSETESYLQYNSLSNTLVDANKNKYKVGHIVNVRLTNVNVFTGSIEYTLIENISIKNKEKNKQKQRTRN